MGVDIDYMHEVLNLAQELFQDEKTNEVPIASIIVKDGQIIAKGLNAREQENKSVIAHAEIKAIEEAARKLNDWNLTGCTLYVNLEPCAMCAGAILQSHISKVVYGAHDAKSGALGSRYDLRTKNLEVKGGVLEEESIELLQSFFKKLRNS